MQIDQIWMTRAIHHWFHDTLVWKRGWSMVYLPAKEAAWVIDHQSTLFPTLPPNCSQDQMQETSQARFCGFCQVFLVTLRQKTCPHAEEKPLYPGNLAVYSFTAIRLKLNGRNSWLREIYCSMDVFYVLRSICKKTSVNILKPCHEIGLSLEESLGEGNIC